MTARDSASVEMPTSRGTIQRERARVVEPARDLEFAARALQRADACLREHAAELESSCGYTKSPLVAPGTGHQDVLVGGLGPDQALVRNRVVLEQLVSYVPAAGARRYGDSRADRQGTGYRVDPVE